jgi:hypothetical protein
MLDATDVKDETELRNEVEPQDTDWEKVVDGPDEPTTDESAQAEAAEEAPSADPTEEAAEEAADGDNWGVDTQRHYIDCIHKARGRLRTTAADWAAAKEEAKEARKAWEAAVESLTGTIDNGPEILPLFDQAGPPVAEAATEVTPDDESVNGSEPAAENESWRAVTLESIGVSAGICVILADNPDKPIATIGDMADWTTQHPDHGDPLLLIPKVGKAKRDQIIECCDRYWEERDNTEEPTNDAPTDSTD